MRRRRPRVPVAPPEPPECIRRFVACEWGWDGPRYVGGRLVLGAHEAHLRHLDAWSEWMDDNGVDLVEWFGRFGQVPR